MNSKVTPLLVVLLVIVSFLAGTMYIRVRNLESGNDSNNNNQAAQVTVSPQQPAEQEPVILTGAEKEEVETGGAAVKGKEGAAITIVEFSEYECPFCQRYIEETYGQIQDEYGDDLRYVFRDYPLQFHQHAKTMANAARCAGEQDKYWEMHDALFKGRDEWVEEKDVINILSTYAANLGLDVASFDQCVAENKYEKEIEADFALGSKMGVGGTPSFFINGKLLVGAQPFSAFKAIIDEELANK